ncbi:hypothetical protein [Fuerstiella marisgermanici]|uniref:Signal peptide prediction n=1 Tax=Fuerstiella marisgermanici TaxID=1891926 RepID=A0A1P8WH65_9PLAN|nr:hypothetical protein [Fuerstiella marisgermanici]APZ93367.1 hypothetical protein Fuma_02984 [Fuerstiella marisgermanici]
MLIIRPIAIIWALPYTILGLLIGLFGLCTRGRVLRRWPLEFYGGGVEWFLSRLPSDLVMAMTLGHVILGRTKAALDISREHELVHVRQYERWGPFLGPAYWACSLFLWLRGKDGYHDNPFEKEAWGE